MAGTHPEDVELLAYVDEELDATRAGEIAAHMRTCETCASQVRDLAAARDALRAAPLLHLPAKRRSSIIGGLPAPDQPARARPRRLLALVTVLLVVAAVLAVVAAQENGPTVGGEAERAAEQAPSQTGETGRDRTGEAGRADDRAVPEAALSGAPPVARVDGPPTRVADFLREQGYDARVVGRSVEVRTRRRAAVQRLLTGRFARGDVAVYVR
jgi:anti-sigma factor RsiW